MHQNEALKARILDFVVTSLETKGALPAGCDLDSFNYIDSGHVDSMGIIKFILDLERAFNIDLDPAEIESPEFRTIGGLVSIISNKLRET